MKRILTFGLAGYWTAHFATGAIFALKAAVDDGVMAVGSIGAALQPILAGEQGLALMFSSVLMLAAALFLWAVMSVLLIGGEESEGDVDEIMRLAIGSGCLATALVFVFAFLGSSPTLLFFAGLQVAGLAASYAAIGAERMIVRANGKPREASRARFRAREASHRSLLTPAAARRARILRGSG